MWMLFSVLPRMFKRRVWTALTLAALCCMTSTLREHSQSWFWGSLWVGGEFVLVWLILNTNLESEVRRVQRNDKVGCCFRAFPEWAAAVENVEAYFWETGQVENARKYLDTNGDCLLSWTWCQSEWLLRPMQHVVYRSRLMQHMVYHFAFDSSMFDGRPVHGLMFIWRITYSAKRSFVCFERSWGPLPRTFHFVLEVDWVKAKGLDIMLVWPHSRI